MLHLPETAHLYALLNYAQASQENYLEPELESYLIQTMLRFSEMPLEEEWALYESNYEELKNTPELSNIEFLKDVADYCLISSGLMEDYFANEKEAFEQFRKVGVDAFTVLSEQHQDKDNIYVKLSQNFMSLVEILKCSHALMQRDIASQSDGYRDSSVGSLNPVSHYDSGSLSTDYHGMTIH